MSKKYKFADNDKIYFVSFAVTNWIDLFIRNEYKEEILNSIRYCQDKKDMDLYGWCIMTSHVHLILGTRGNPLQNIMRDLKKTYIGSFTKLFKAIIQKAGRNACPSADRDALDSLSRFFGNGKSSK
jgi:REP element-mobilizing transposase RayT